jgi:hypothetical protein
MDNTQRDLENSIELAKNNNSSSYKVEPKEWDPEKLHPKHKDENKYRKYGKKR